MRIKWTGRDPVSGANILHLQLRCKRLTAGSGPRPFKDKRKLSSDAPYHTVGHHRQTNKTSRYVSTAKFAATMVSFFRLCDGNMEPTKDVGSELIDCVACRSSDRCTENTKSVGNTDTIPKTSGEHERH